MCSENMGLLDPKSDYIFKLIFGVEKNKPLLISLLNAILKGDPEITDLQLQNTEVVKQFEKGRSARLDIKAQIRPQEYVDIDMQVQNEGHVIDRAIQYTQCMSCENFYLLSEEEKKKGLRQNYSYPKVIGIWITGENIFNDCDEPVTELGWVRNNRPGFVTKKTRLFTIELPKFKVETMDKQNPLDRWMAFLTRPRIDAECTDKSILRAFEELTVISATKEVRETYKSLMDAKIDQAVVQSEAERKGMEKGLAKGLAKGLEKGMEKGLEKGMEKGMEKGLEKGMEKGLKKGERIGIEKMVKSLLKAHVDINVISATSGLTISEVEELND